MELWLSGSCWLAGDSFSLADIAYTPYLTHFEHLQGLGVLDKRPRDLEWYERIKKRLSYAVAISKWLNEKYLVLMKEKGQEFWPCTKEIISKRQSTN